ncbi:Fic family protein [Leptotrichia massiliensis]|uniref:Fic family protein n=1 Tax=Leptotrichia massiliensis TaxID=1852388 RepID=UPI0028D7A4AB|nr:Fic family protein [Leptotrichia massiliensis]
MLLIESEYKKIQETTDKYKKQKYWKIAVGLNQVDDLKTSEELRKLAYENINNIKTYVDVEDELHQYYSKSEKINNSEYECDLVSLKIVELLDNSSFNLTINTLKNIHKELFENIINEEFCGKFRKFDIQKYEDILNGDSANYGNFRTIEEGLKDIANELNIRKYEIDDTSDIVKLAVDCVKKIWDVHPFVEGNTRTTIVFMLKFLDSLGIEDVSNDLFKDNAKYFRDCLVLANYSQLNRYNEFIKLYIKPLYRFFEKFLINDKLELIEIEPVHNNKYYNKIENPSKLMEYEGLNEDLDLDW